MERVGLFRLYAFLYGNMVAVSAGRSQSGLPADFPLPEEDPGTGYDPSAALAKEAERKNRAEELRQTRRKMDRDTLAAKREARRSEPPTTVRAYQEIYRKFPVGWPPDPYPEESQI